MQYGRARKNLGPRRKYKEQLIATPLIESPEDRDRVRAWIDYTLDSLKQFTCESFRDELELKCYQNTLLTLRIKIVGESTPAVKEMEMDNASHAEDRQDRQDRQ